LRLPLIRCCNNGITCWIDPFGRLHNVDFADSTSVYQSGYKLVEVPLPDSERGYQRTFYCQFGDLFGWSCVVLVAFSALKPLSRRRSPASPTPTQPPPRNKRKVP
jgi:apolipoprotein N-acyltransferase